MICVRRFGNMRGQTLTSKTMMNTVDDTIQAFIEVIENLLLITDLILISLECCCVNDLKYSCFAPQYWRTHGNICTFH